MKNLKDKINKKKFELTVISLALLVVALLKIVMTATVSAASDDVSSIPSLFYNDRYFTYSVPGNIVYWPLEQRDGIYYIPVNILASLNDMEINGNYAENFYVRYKSNGGWISFKVSEDRAQSRSREYIYCKIYKLHGTTYVPAKIVADSLGLIWEVRPEYNTGRIKESSATRSFDDMLYNYIPHTQPTTTAAPTTRPIPTTSATTQPSIETPTTKTVVPEPTTIRKPTEPPVTTTAGNTEDTKEIQNYLTFYGSSASYGYFTDLEDRIDEVLKLLDKNNMRATFFFSAAEIAGNPDILREIYAAGHEIGIKLGGGKTNFGEEELVSELEAANELIYATIKHKTRFFMSLDSAADKYSDALALKGYYLCKKTVGVSDLRNVNTQNKMVAFIKQNTVNIFTFDLSGGYKDYIELSAKASEVKFYIKFSYINNANIEDIKK